MKFESLDEQTLLEKCLQQDKKAWDAFVERYNRIISHAIVHTLRKYSFDVDNQIVSDLFNTVFLSFIEHNYKKLRQSFFRLTVMRPADQQNLIELLEVFSNYIADTGRRLLLLERGRKSQIVELTEIFIREH